MLYILRADAIVNAESCQTDKQQVVEYGFFVCFCVNNHYQSVAEGDCQDGTRDKMATRDRNTCLREWLILLGSALLQLSQDSVWLTLKENNIDWLENYKNNNTTNKVGWKILYFLLYKLSLQNQLDFSCYVVHFHCKCLAYYFTHLYYSITFYNIKQF